MTNEELVKAATDAGFIIRSKDEETTFLTAHEKAVIEKGIKPEVFKIHTAYAKDIEEMTGQKVPEGEKPYKFFKQIMPDIMKRANEAKSYQEKMTALETQIKDGKLDDVAKSKIADLERERDQLKEIHKKSEKEWEGKFQTEKQSTVNTRKKSDLSHALVGVKFIDKSIVAEDVRQIVIDQKITELLAISDYDEKGVMIFKDQNGDVMRDKKTMEPLTAIQVLTDRLASIIDKGVQQPGLGADGKKKEPGKDVQLSGIVIPATIVTRMQLTTFLQNKLQTGEITQEQYNLAYKENYKDLKIA